MQLVFPWYTENGISILTFHPMEMKPCILTFSGCISTWLTGMVVLLKNRLLVELDAEMLDVVLNKKIQNSCLKALFRNMFTIKTGEGFYRYHALSNSLLMQRKNLQPAAAEANVYFDKSNIRAAQMPLIQKTSLLEKIILSCYKVL